MTLVPPQDALFLLGETRENPTHVTALQIFRPPPGREDTFAGELLGLLTDDADLKPAFTRRPVRSWATAGAFSWEPDEEFDLSAHVRRTAIPAPGRVRELLEHVSAMHARPLDRSRPLWEAEIVSGLADGRVALVTRLHHSMFDGITLVRHMLGGLSPDPDARDAVAPWTRTRASKERAAARAASSREGAAGEGVGGTVVDLVRGAATAAARVAGGLPALGSALATVVRGQVGVAYAAPHTRFNERLSGSRRFAGESWELARLAAVADAAGCSVNDVGLALCGGALRAYLSELSELPDRSLVAMVPVSLRGTDTSTEGTSGNSWGSVYCVLGTDVADPAARLERVRASMADGKAALRGLDPVAAVALNVASMGLAAVPTLRFLPQPPRPVFNLIISNVPSADRTLYLDGAELTDNYPVSMVSDGQALNVTLMRYADRMAFGLTGCPRAVPRLQGLLGHLDSALGDLEAAVGVVSPAPG